jgi:hypothetical protein
MSNCVVKHIVWGRGVIQSRSEKYIKILFDDPAVGEKTFIYPDAFSKYITYEDKECQTQVEEELKVMSKAAEEQAAKAEKERLAAVAAAREKEKNLISMRKKAIAYSRKRAEKLRVKFEDKEEQQEQEEDTRDDAYSESYEGDDGDNEGRCGRGVDE